MVAILNLLAVVAVASATVLPRNGACIQTDLNTIDSDTKKLTSAVNSWNGQAATVGPIQSAESQVETDLKNANKNAPGCAPVSSSDATTIITYINGTLRTDVESSLSALNSKKSSFTAAGLNGVVKSDLQNLQNLTATYANTLIGITPTAQKSAASSVAARLNYDFQVAINNFS